MAYIDFIRNDVPILLRNIVVRIPKFDLNLFNLSQYVWWLFSQFIKNLECQKRNRRVYEHFSQSDQHV